MAASPQDAAIATPVNAFLVRKGEEPQVIDLNGKFGTGYTFSVQTSNGDSVAATVDANGLLKLSFGDYGHSDIRITATASDGSAIVDDFRVRVAGENAYTIAVIPDTQDYTANYASPSIFSRMTQWLVDNKESLNIQFVTHVGDVTYHNTDAEWQRAEESLRILDGKLPYSILPGNHDLASGGSAGSRTLDNLSKYFTVAEQSKLPGFGGVYDKEPESFWNSYHTFTAPDGTKWLNLSLEFGPRDDVLRWAAEVIEGHLDHRVIVTTHGYMAGDERVGSMTPQLTGENAGPAYGVGNDERGSSDGDGIWEKLVSKYPNVAFTFSGHNFIDGAQTQISYGAGGQPVFQMMVNYQNGVAAETTGNGNEANGSNGGNGAIRLITIDPENDAVYTETYFTEFDDYLDGYRGKPELDRDGLTGYYAGHQETFTGVDLSTPLDVPVAKAGKDLFVEATGDVAHFRLDASQTILPADADVSYVWKDSEGTVVATGRNPFIYQEAGSRVLTLEVTDANGYTSADDVRVTVIGKNTLLSDNFNDGNTNGWSAPTDIKLAELGAPSDFGLPEMTGGEAEILKFPKYTKQQHLLFKPELANVPANGLVTSYTFAFDVLLPTNSGGWWSLFQTDVTNNSDAEFYLRNDNDGTGSLGISSVYQGDFKYGSWQRVAFTFEKQTDSSYIIKKYIEGQYVGQQTDSYRGGRFDIDPTKGVLLFTDDDSDTTGGYINSFLFADHALSQQEITSFGKASAGGISSQAIAGATQFDFTNGKLSATFGTGTLNVPDVVVSSPLKVVGTVKSGETDGEGTLKDLTNGGTNILVWNNVEAKQWNDYVYDLTLRTNDNSGQIGVVFRYQDQSNYYRVTFDINGNARSLVKVQNGQTTVLAQVEKGIVMDADAELRVAVIGNEIRVLLDNHDIFGGPVTDSAPLAGGTVGVYSSAQDTASFDNVLVNKVALTAHGETGARVLDSDGDGNVQVSVSAVSSFGPREIVEYRWVLGDKVVATGKNAVVTLPVNAADITLEVRDAAGNWASDKVLVDIAAQKDILLQEDFSAGTAGWRFVDEGEYNADANWRVTNGELVQDANVYSRQLTSGWNATSSNLWDRGWSPLGDGDYILRKGTYAVYEGAGASQWQDYSVETLLNVGQGKSTGVLFYYQDENNYYKLDINKENQLIQITRLVDGIETILGRTGGHISRQQDTLVRVDIEDHVITVTIDGEKIFANVIEDRSLDHGTIALYNWGAANGLSYDDVKVVSLKDVPVDTTPPTIAGIRALTDDVGADTVVFEVTFDEAVKDVDAADFALIATGLKDGYAIDKVEGEGSTWTVTVTGVVGRGSLALALAQDVAITDAAGNALAWSDVSAAHQVLSPYEIVKNQFGGNDIYLYDADALVADLGTNAIDRVFYDGEKATVVLPDNIEQGTLLDAAKDSSLFGGAGDNTLTGNAFDNVIRGGAGRDVMTGGKGADTFLFDAADQSGARQIDLVTDFN
ncbi:hypothetical protein ACFFJ7_09780, partial [Pseudochelatococcus lubricantis]|uniref:hypothetical protein n=1 Tax=Pseudochelatococcus lubricantis TaxID=1538102 RepID=UPI0035EC497D